MRPFDPATWIEYSADFYAHRENIATFKAEYGKEQLSLLASHFSVPLLAVCPKHAVDGETEVTAANLEAQLQSDWLTFKSDLYSGQLNQEQAMNTKFAAYWSQIELHYSPRYPFLIVLIMLTLCLPIGTAECERIFSLMNRLKDAVHNRRSNSTLRDWIMVLCNGPKSLGEFETAIDRFIDSWESTADRRPNIINI